MMNREWLAPFRNRGFGYLFAGQLISGMGDWFSYIIIPILLYRLTDNPVSIGILMVCRMLPSLLLSPVIGKALARFSIVRVMILGDLVRGIAYLAMLFAGQPLWIYVLSVIISTGSAFFNPGKYTLIPKLVPQESLARANSFVEGVNQFMMLLGPALGGVLFSLIGMKAGLLFNAATFFVSMLALMRVRVPKEQGKAEEQAGKKQSALRRYREVLHGLTKRRAMLYLLVSCTFSIIGFGGSLSVLFPVVAEDVFHSEAVYGWVMSCLGGGLFLGTMAAPSLQKKVPPYLLYGLGTLIGGCFVLLFGLSGIVWLSVLAIALVGFHNGVEDNASTTYLQVNTAETNDTADVFSLLASAQSATMIFGMSVSTLVARMIGVQHAIQLFSLFPIVFGSAVTVSFFATIRRREKVSTIEMEQGSNDIPGGALKP